MQVLVTDSSLRELERRFRASGSVEDEAAWLRERVQAGELSQSKLEVAASLGHPAARELCPEVGLVDWSDETLSANAIRSSAELLGVTLPARVALDCAERIPPATEAESRDMEGSTALVRAWLDCPCERHLREAMAATDQPQYFIWDNATPPLAAVKHAVNAAYLGALDLGGAFQHGRSSRDAMEAAKLARNAAADPEAELEWQRLRLAAYVLGEADGD